MPSGSWSPAVSRTVVKAPGIPDPTQTAAIASTTAPQFGVYVHWPFCLSKCPYCDFNSHVSDGVSQVQWARALITDLAHYAADTEGRTVTSIFFGGGTPSLMAPETVDAVIGSVKSFWPTAPNLEISLEANPTSVEIKTFANLKDAGINRLSIGIQAFNDADLRALGRQHSAQDAKAALDQARDVFQEYSFDLIYARPGQAIDAWRKELVDALTFAGTHLSFYQLTIESGTPFHRDGIQAANPDVGAALYQTTLEVLSNAGLPDYEISNHARPGHECRHNLSIWQGWDYVGVGPGAHGRIAVSGGSQGTHQIHNPERWLEAIETRGHGVAKRRDLSRQDRAAERIMMGLRLRAGINRPRFRAQTGQDVMAFLKDSVLSASIAEGYVTLDDATLAATDEGRLRLNSLLAALLI